VIRGGRRFHRTAVASQIGRDHRVTLGQLGRDFVPHRMGLRIAVQQQQRRTGAAEPQAQRAIADFNRCLFETRKESTFSHEVSTCAEPFGTATKIGEFYQCDAKCAVKVWRFHSQFAAIADIQLDLESCYNAAVGTDLSAQ
jgi:hypothetical protein